ncbi:MAG: HEAT repeat domain-containing protein [Pirellulales bacterium]
MITISLVSLHFAHSVLAEKISIETTKSTPVKMASVDTIVLLNQGRIEGKLLTVDPDQSVYEIALSSGGILSIEKDQIERVIRQNKAIDEYHRISPTYENTALKQWELTTWCSKHHLKDQSLLHAQRVVQLDPGHSKAHALLGNSYRNGEWVHRDVYMKSKGYIKYDGSWISQERAALREIRARRNEHQNQWRFDLIQWRKGLDDPRVEESEIKIYELKDPAAVAGIIYLLGREDRLTLQDAYIEVLGNIGDSSAMNFLIFHSVFQNNERFRDLCLKQVLRHRSPYFVGKYAKYLDHYDNGIVLRAAYALGRLEYRSAVVPLANALETKHISLEYQGKPIENIPYFPSFQKYGNRFEIKGPRVSTINLTTEKFIDNSLNQYSILQVRNRGVREALIHISEGLDFEYAPTAWKSWYTVQLASKTPEIRGRRDQ